MRVVTRAIAFALLLLGAAPAAAHPHIFIDARATVTFNDAGEIVAIHNEWTFDEAFSAWTVQGLDTDSNGEVTRQELQELADENIDGLSQYGFYTFAGEGSGNLSFAGASNSTIDYVGGRTVHNFDVVLETPYAIKDRLEIAINDPEYYVGITFKDASAVTLINAPSHCSVGMEPGHDMPEALADQLFSLPPEVTSLPPDLAAALRGVQGAILVACPGGSAASGGGIAAAAATSPATALEAANALGTAAQPQANASLASTTGAAPFGGPPPEPGLTMPRSGVLGWVAQQQKEFYQAITASLATLRSDWTAFWVLGGLSFLYGVFHAAGPGHGKVVISSYVVANEAQARRGVLLSFLSAMLQSVVAIGFVLVASGLLGLTSLAMNDAANWIGIASYALVALLGLWLICSKLFGWGHHHHAHPKPAPRPRNDMHLRARQHLGAPAHALAVGGPALTSFRSVAASADAHGRLPDDPHYGHGHGPDDQHHGHVHAITPDQLGGGWKEQLGLIVAVGMRPCSGALVVLAFALSQGLLAAGIAAVLLMGLGTALTTGVLAALAVGAKGLAASLSGTDNKLTTALVWWAELMAAVAVFAFGLVLLLASL